jgi:hypothetical protein
VGLAPANSNEILERRTGVRLATAADTEAVMALLRLMHAETALASLDERKVRDTVEGCLKQGFIGVAHARDGEIVGTFGLTFTSYWYTSDVHLAELWMFVRADERQSKHAVRLLRLVNAIGEHMRLPVFGGVLTIKDTERKCAFFARHMRPVGQMFLGGWSNG